MAVGSCCLGVAVSGISQRLPSECVFTGPVGSELWTLTSGMCQHISCNHSAGSQLAKLGVSS